MPKLHFDMWVLIAHYLGEEAITLAHAFRGDLILADALCDVSENYYLARCETTTIYLTDDDVEDNGYWSDSFP